MDIQDYYENNQDEIFANRDELQAYKDKIRLELFKELDVYRDKLFMYSDKLTEYMKNETDKLDKYHLELIQYGNRLTKLKPSAVIPPVITRKEKSIARLKKWNIDNPIKSRMTRLAAGSMKGRSKKDIRARAELNYKIHKEKLSIINSRDGRLKIVL